MARRQIDGMRAVITGASSGIGRELALQLASLGARVVAVARREDRLRGLRDEAAESDGEIKVLTGDITSADTRQAMLELVRKEFGRLDALINNAGIGAIGPFQEADPDRLRQVMEVNFFAPVQLIRLSLPLLRLGHRPIIVNLGSVLGHRAVPNKSEYCASKFALHGFSDSLRAELAGQGIDVLLVSPSTTATEFFDRVIEDCGAAPAGKGRAAPAPVVARKTIRAMQRGKHEIILSAGGRLLVWIDRTAPTLANRLVARYG